MIRRSRTSHEVRGLKLTCVLSCLSGHPSHLTRGAWIEIGKYNYRSAEDIVAPHTRCVD